MGEGASLCPYASSFTLLIDRDTALSRLNECVDLLKQSRDSWLQASCLKGLEVKSISTKSWGKGLSGNRIKIR